MNYFRATAIRRLTPWVLGAAALVALLLASARPGQADVTKNQCAICHGKQDEARLSKCVGEWQKSVHARNGVECQGCHGGDATTDDMEKAMDRTKGFIGVPTRKDIPALCAKCHSDPVRMRPFRVPISQYQQYQQSVHGKKLAQGDPNVATCADCHGAHMTLGKNDPNSPVYVSNVPKTCGGCHADAKRMASYGIPTSQLADYTSSVHGHALLQKDDRAAPNCASCHSPHGAVPPGAREVADVCGTCHTEQEKYLKQGPHWQAIQATGTPRCVDCHSNHHVVPPSDAMLSSSEQRGCGSCHAGGDKGSLVAKQIAEQLSLSSSAWQKTLAETNRAQAAGMDVGDIQADMSDVNTKLLESRVVLHSLSVQLVAAKVDPAREQLAKDLKSALADEAASVERRKTLGIAGVAVVLLAGALYWKWALIRAAWASRQT